MIKAYWQQATGGVADFTEFVKRSTKGNAEQIKEAQVNAYKFRKIYEDAMTKMTEEHDKEAKKRVQIAKQEAKDVADAEKFLVEAKIILTTNANTRMRLEEEKLHKERIDNLEQDKWILPDKQGEIYRLIEAETQRHKRRMGELAASLLAPVKPIRMRRRGPRLLEKSRRRARRPLDFLRRSSMISTR